MGVQNHEKAFLAMVLAAAMMLTAMVGCGNGNTQDGGNANNAGATGDTIKIGGLAPLTGDVSVYGVAVDNGVKMAVEEINADGGVLGKQIEYIVYDEKGDATGRSTLIISWYRATMLLRSSAT